VTDAVASGRTLRRLEVATAAGLDALREVTQGLFPVVLARRGLIAALRDHCVRVGRPGVLSAPPDLHGQRFDEQVEAAAYFCAVAVLREAEVDPAARLALAVAGGCLVLTVTGISRRLENEAGERAALVDRVEAVGGRMSYARGADGQLAVRAEFPIDPRSDGPAADLAVHPVASGLSG
jgi:hypothetical protein